MNKSHTLDTNSSELSIPKYTTFPDGNLISKLSHSIALSDFFDVQKSPFPLARIDSMSLHQFSLELSRFREFQLLPLQNISI
jgi:hypothetical protein